MSPQEVPPPHALSERDKMLLGLPHDGNEDADLLAARLRTMGYLRSYNVSVYPQIYSSSWYVK